MATMTKLYSRITITGPECSGKTTLAAGLHDKLGGTLIPEYARRYLTKLGMEYEQDDLDAIALGQMRQWIPAFGDPIICDTDMTTMLIWSEEKYDTTSPLIQKLYEAQQFDLYVLCAPDMPFEEDPLRESPNDRQRLFELYEAKLQEAGRPFLVVRGNQEQRLEQLQTHMVK